MMNRIYAKFEITMKRITIHNVAKFANVSVATVSRVINTPQKVREKNRQKVEEAIKILNYSPNDNAKALASNGVHTIGVVVADVTEPFFAILVKNVDKTATKYQKSILIGLGYHQAEKERNAIEQLIRKRCRCLVVHSKALSDEILRHYLQQESGMVLINRMITGFEDRCINLDNQKGTYLATNLLIDLGHQYIGYIGSNHQISDEIERLKGYQQAMREQQIPLIPYATTQDSPNFEGGAQGMIKLLSLNTNLTAVVTYNDEMAAGAISVLNENNYKIPEQMSIIGFDDMPVASYLTPKLTTIRYPIDLMAAYATELALSLVDESIQSPQQMKFNPTVVRRFSICKK